MLLAYEALMKAVAEIKSVAGSKVIGLSMSPATAMMCYHYNGAQVTLEGEHISHIMGFPVTYRKQDTSSVIVIDYIETGIRQSKGYQYGER